MKLYKVKKSKIDNQGVYAAKNIKAGTIIIYYKGKIITKKETDRNPKYDNDKAIYLFNLNSRYDLDDYGFGFDEDYKQFPCRCKSKNCCGYIVREGSRWRIKKLKKRKKN